MYWLHRTEMSHSGARPGKGCGIRRGRLSQPPPPPEGSLTVSTSSSHAPRQGLPHGMGARQCRAMAIASLRARRRARACAREELTDGQLSAGHQVQRVAAAVLEDDRVSRTAAGLQGHRAARCGPCAVRAAPARRERLAAAEAAAQDAGNTWVFPVPTRAADVASRILLFPANPVNL